MPTPVPPLLRKLTNNEYTPLPRRRSEEAAIADAGETTAANSRRLSLSTPAYVVDRRGTATTLRAIDRGFGSQFYSVPAEAEIDVDTANEVFAGPSEGVVIDVQTHFASTERFLSHADSHIYFLHQLDPDRWGLDADPLQMCGAEWAALIFGSSETQIAVLTSPPGRDRDGEAILSSGEIAAARDLVERYAGSKRLLTHTIVHPNYAGEIEAMADWSSALQPNGWKTYTSWEPPEHKLDNRATGGWRLDDERYGIPFLEQVSRLGPPLVAVHKGLTLFIPGNIEGMDSPADVGPAARMFPDIRFLVYHSGYAFSYTREEGPDTEVDREYGVNRLTSSLRDAGVGPGQNVYAELGSTWFLMVRRPVEAAHVLGKLLLAVGPDRILWGTDCVFYGSPQALIDSFRSFTIPEWMQEEFGYPALTAEIKTKILGQNAIEVYGIPQSDIDAAVADADRGWVSDLERNIEHEVIARAVGIKAD
jgi:uncharacterized protein